jgi:hypothetical protein
MSAAPMPQEPQAQDVMSKVEEVAEAAFFMCLSQAYEGLIDYRSKEGKRLYALAKFEAFG